MTLPLLPRIDHWATPRRLLLATLVIGVLARLAAIILASDVDLSSAQIWEYGDQARCAFSTGGDLCLRFHDVTPYASAYMPPLASYLWLGLFHLFGETSLAPTAYLVLSLAAAAACIALLFDLTLQITASRWASAGAAAMLALYPTFVFVSATYHTTNIALMLNLLLLRLAIQAARGPVKPMSWFAMGVVCALCALVRSELLAVTPLIVALASAWRWPNLRTMLGILVVAGLAMMLTLAPWVARNYATFHQVIPVANSSGYNLWKGFGHAANGSGNFIESSPQGAAESHAIRALAPFGPNFEVRQEAAFKHAAIAAIESASPARLIGLTLNKIAMLWVFDWTDPLTHKVGYWVPWLVANLLAAVGAARLLVRRTDAFDPLPASFVAAMLILLTGVYALTAVHARYRMHIEPFLFILAGIGLKALGERLLPFVFRPAAAAPLPSAS